MRQVIETEIFKAMKKLFIILLPILLGGCQKDFNSIVDPQPENYQVTGIITANQFTYNPGDSLITTCIALNSSMNVKNVSFNIFSSDQIQLNAGPVQMFDNGNLAANGDSVKGDNIFSSKFPLSHYYPKGSYEIDYYVTDNSGNSKLPAVHFFTYDNGQANVAPVISSLVAPDTVSLSATTTPILLTVQVHDDNGLNDIQAVFFNSFIPPDDHPSSGNPWAMYDNGSNGDKAAGDGIFSLTIGLPSNAQKGTYRFEFQAKDRSGLLSNTITHNIVVK